MRWGNIMYTKSALTKSGAIICIIVVALFGIILLVALLASNFDGENPFLNPLPPPEPSGGIHITITPRIESAGFTHAGNLLLVSHLVITGIIGILSICILVAKRTLALSIINLFLSSYVLLCYGILYDCCGVVFLLVPILCIIGSLLSIIGSCIDRGRHHD